MRSKLRFCLFLIILLICSCELSKPEDVLKSEVEQQIQKLQNNFLDVNVSAIINQYSSGFLHNGNHVNQERVIWQNRLAEYDSFEFTDLHVTEHADTIVVSGTVHWHKGQEVVTSLEPDEHGDFSYLQKVDGIWLFTGNQHGTATGE